MPTFGSIPLISSSGMSSGAAFLLHRPAHESETVTVDGWEVEVAQRKRVVLARGGSESNYQDAFRAGLLIAQRGLDLMSMRGANNLAIKEFDDEHLTWWPESTGLTVRVVSFAPVGIDIPPATVTVTNASGKVVGPPAQKAVVWHESFRYFRLSQTTDDLFDAYRNAYLALESVLSSIAPQHTNAAGKVIEAEGIWFKRALNEANKISPLASFVPSGTADPVQYLWDELYRDMRSAMSHAKSGRKVLLPQDEAERKAVTASLRRLAELYLRLAEAHLGARRAGGGMFAIAFRMMAMPILDAMTVTASDDESPFSAADTVPNPAGGTLRPLLPGPPAASPEPFAVTRVWSAVTAALAGLPFIRRIVGVNDGAPAMAAVLEERLILGQAMRLEVMLGVRGTNTRQPRQRYSF